MVAGSRSPQLLSGVPRLEMVSGENGRFQRADPLMGFVNVSMIMQQCGEEQDT